MKISLLLIITFIGSQAVFGQFLEINYLEANARVPRNIQIGDMDGDGDNDIISAHWSHGRIGFHENLGEGQFLAPRLIDDLSSVVSYIQIVDVDEDGVLDVVVAHYGSYRVIWYKNNGDGTFTEPELLIFSISNLEEVRVVDIDADGDMDVVTGRAGGSSGISWHEKIGDLYYEHGVASNYWHLELADLNGDGLLDIIGSGETIDEVAWFENLGGDFSEGNIISVSLDGPTSVHAADINGDGLIDVVVTSKDDNKVAWFENLGDETFGSENTVTSGAVGAQHSCSADIDGDGDLDIVVAAKVGDEYLWYENLADGTLFTEHLISTEDDAYYVTAGDLNGDGNIDIAMNSNNGDMLISWSENLGTELDTPKRITSRMKVVTSLDANDLDGDGDIDIIASAEEYYKVAWFENLGDNNFNIVDTIPANHSASSYVTSGDIDGDGDIDIVSVGEDYASQDQITWNENLGGGTFASAEILADDILVPRFARLIDMDVDGDLDLVAGSALSPLYEFVWFENVGGVFTTEHIISTTYLVRFAEFGDYDLDGDIDVIVLQSTKASLLENLGDGTFAEEVIIESGFSTPRDMCVLDVDIDGDLDLVLAATPTPVFAWYENEDGVFSEAAEIGDSDVKFSVHAADVNLDGKEDLVVSAIEEPGDHDYRRVQWYENIGDGTFGSEVSLFHHEDGTNNAITADVDGDGDRDVIFGTGGIRGGTIGWLEMTLVDSVLGLPENSQNKISIYPNPFDEFTIISFGEELTENHTVIIYNILGEEVYRNEYVTGKSLEIKKTDWSAGVYILNLFSVNLEKAFSTKLVVE